MPHASQIYMPVRVLSLEIREGHYAERGRSSLPRGMAVSALSTKCLEWALALALGKRAC